MSDLRLSCFLAFRAAAPNAAVGRVTPLTAVETPGAMVADRAVLAAGTRLVALKGAVGAEHGSHHQVAGSPSLP